MAGFDYDPKVARAFLEVAEKRGANRQQTLALLAAGLVESNMDDIDYGDRDSLGPLQQRPSQGWGTPEQVQDPVYAANAFLDRAMKIGNAGGPGDLAARVQRPAKEYEGRYAQRLDDAIWLLQNLKGAAAGGGGGGGRRAGQAASRNAAVPDDEEDHTPLLQTMLQSMAQKIRDTPGGDDDATAEDEAVRLSGDVGRERGEAEALAEADAAAVEVPDGELKYTQPAPEKLAWGGHDNGKIPMSELMKITGVHYSGEATHYFQQDAGQQFKAMLRDAKRDGVTITLTDSYRSYAAQEDLKRRKPTMSATPGKSVHGWGKAIDVAGDDARKWIQRNGEKYGWLWPEWARNTNGQYEPWHFEWRGTGGGRNRKAQ